MNLKVIHLIRKIERIDRDMEEIENFLNTLQMDREYSYKLRDSLIEEFHRLKKLKKDILKQVVYIPPHFESFLNQMNLQSKSLENGQTPDIEFFTNNTNLKEKHKNINDTQENNLLKEEQHPVEYKIEPEEKQKTKQPEIKNNSSKLTSEKKISREETNENSKKHSPFIFRFE